MATDRHPGTMATPGGFKATGYVQKAPEEGINWIDKYGSMDWGNALKTGDFGLTDAERATQLANTVRINNEEMAKAQAARAAAAQVSQAPPRMPAPIQGPMRQGGSYPYQIPNRTFEWSTTPQEQMALAGRMNRQDLQPLLSSGEYGPLAGQNYRYTPQGTTQINYGPGGGYGGGYGWPTGGWPTGGWPTGGYPTGGTPTGGTPTGGTPTGGTPTGGTPTGGTPTGGTPTGGTPWVPGPVPAGEEWNFREEDWRGPEAGWGTTPGQQIGRAVVQPGGGIKFGGLNAGEIKAINDATRNYKAGILSPLAGTTGYTGAVDDFSVMGADAAGTRANELRARQQQTIMNMENQRRAQAQAAAASRAPYSMDQLNRQVEARQPGMISSDFGSGNPFAAARAATSRAAALPPTVRAAQERAANQRRVEQASQQQRQAEMERRANQQQAQQQAAAVVRQTQQRDRGAEQAKQAREQASRAQESAKRAQEQSRAQAASKAAASRAQQARVEATERSKRESARASQAASQAASRARAAERERATVAASRKTPAPKVTPVSRRTGGKKKVSKAPTRPGGR